MSLEVERGEVFGLLGPNGAGKTTTLRVLTTLLKPDAGSALVAGWDVRAEALAVRAVDRLRPAGAVGRRRADGAAENLDFYARVTGVPRRERAQRIAAAVEAMELEPMLDRARRARSRAACCGGWRSPRALLNRPRVLFLDEPTVGLDPTARRLVWERLHALRGDAGTTIVVTTHLMEEAERHCDRLAIMDGGAHGRARRRRASCCATTACGRSRRSSGPSPATRSPTKGGYSDVRAQRRVARRLG